MMFDVNSAKQAGYSDTEIADFLAKQNPKFDIDSARKAGYSDNEIVSHLSTTPQMSGIMREPALAGSNFAQGAASLLTIPHALSDLEERYVAAPLARKIEGLPASFGVGGGANAQNIFLNSHDVNDALQKAGIANRPDLQPQDAGERFLASMSRGAGAVAPIAATGGLGAIPYGIAQGAGAGAATQGLHEAGINNPYLDFGAGVLGGATAGALESAGARAINSLTGNLTPMAAAYKGAGVTPTLAGDVSQSTPLQMLQAYATKAPIGAGGIEEASDEAVKNFGDKVEDLADSYGNSRTLQQAGSALQRSGKKWLQNFKTESENKWDAVDKAIGPSTTMTMPNTQTLLNNLSSIGSGNQSAQQFLTSPLAKDFNSILEDAQGNYKPASINPDTLLINPSTGAQGAPLTWETVQKLRGRVGEYLENPSLIPDAGGAQAKQLYASLSQDMQNTALLNGRVAQNAFNTANAYTKAGHDFIDNNLNDILQAPTPEQAASNVLATAKRGGTTLQALRDQMPDATDELAAFNLRNAALARTNTPTGNTVTPTGFANEFNPKTRMTPEAFNALYPDPADQNTINALSMIGQGMKGTESFVNRSNTATNLQTLELGTIGGAIYAGHEAAGLPGAIAAGSVATLPYAMGPIASKISTNPAIISMMSGQAAQAPSGLPWWLQQGAATYGNQ